MIVREHRVYDLELSEVERNAIIGALAITGANSVLPETAGIVANLMTKIKNGERLTCGEADDLRVAIIRYGKVTYGYGEWPRLIGEIADELQTKIH